MEVSVTCQTSSLPIVKAIPVRLYRPRPVTASERKAGGTVITPAGKGGPIVLPGGLAEAVTGAVLADRQDARKRGNAFAMLRPRCGNAKNHHLRTTTRNG